jgi:hypothetical protein
MANVSRRAIGGDAAQTVDAQRLVHAGNDEQQADSGIVDQVLERIEPVVAGPIRDGDGGVVEDRDEAGHVALGRHVAIAGRPTSRSARRGCAR